MNTESASPRRYRQRMVLLAGAALLMGAGCQTFSLSEEDFRKQQRGQMVDRETGDIVGAAGTLGYYGAVIGAVAAEAVRK